MRISMIGAGRVAHHLAQKLTQHHQIRQIYSRRLAQAEALAAQVGAEAIQDISAFDQNADLVIIAVSDHSIAQVIQQCHTYLAEALIVHTSGSTHLDVLKHVHARSGVFYPLQTFSLDRKIEWSTTPLFVEATTSQDTQILKTLADELSQHVYTYSSEQRLSLHLAAVFACNFSNYCYDMAKQVLDAQQVDFSLLYPLILETAHKATQHEPQQMQTGPAMRGDLNILQMHREMLQQSAQVDLSHVYTLLSEQLLQRHQP